MMASQPEGWVVMGRVAGVFGVQGWVRVQDYTETGENLAGYRRWRLQQGAVHHEVQVASARRHGKGLVAKFAGLDDRDAAAELVGAEILIRRDALPPTEQDQYYWADLIGLRVIDLEGRELGRVDHLLATGANDVLVIEGERRRLIPFLQERVVRRVDLDAGTILVDWDPTF